MAPGDDDLYQLLEVDRGAAEDDIKRAYRKMALKHHPDKNQGDPHAHDRFKRISRAYAVLSDPQKRAAYDRFGVVDDQAAGGGGGDEGFSFSFGGGGGGGFPFPGLDEILTSMFMGSPAGGFPGVNKHGTFVFNMGSPHVHQQPPQQQQSGEAEQRSKNIVHEVRLSLEDLRKGCSKRVEADVRERCEACAGCGVPDASRDVHTCSPCGGRGVVTASMFPPFVTELNCPHCGGRGSSIRPGRACASCQGSGSSPPRRKAFDVRLPPGIPNGHNVVLHGKGHHACQQPGRAGIPGDIVVSFKHDVPPNVRVDYGTGDVTMSVDVDVRDLFCGVSAKVAPCGEACELELEGYVDPSHPHRVPGMGLPCAMPAAAPDASRMGDLVIEWRVVFPDDVPQVRKYVDVLRRIFKRGPTTTMTTAEPEVN